MTSLDELRGVDALEYAKTLRKVGSNPETWEVEYLDETTGQVWVLDYPDSQYQGGGSPRLRKKQ